MQLKGRFALTAILILSSCGFVFGSTPLNDLTSPVSIKIVLKKAVVNVGEPIEGEFILGNSYPSNLPVVFDIRLFHDDELSMQTNTSVDQLPMGVTKFAFKNFGMPQFNKNRGSEGIWRINIVQ